MLKLKDYFLIDKSVYFPKSGILAFGDLHLGYEAMLKERGFEIPFNHLEESKKNIDKIINLLKKFNFKIKKIIILGDLKHYFGFSREETFEVRDFLKFLENFVQKEYIVLIKGNHEKIELDKERYTDFYIENNIAFIHGDKLFPEILDKEIKTIILGHVHPSVTLSEKKGIKKEKYKCFLIGKWKNKNTIVLPSFFPFVEGTSIDKYDLEDENFCIIDKNKLKNFKVYIIGEDKVYPFGKLKELG